MNNIFSNMSDKEIALRVLKALDEAKIEYSFGRGGVKFDGFLPAEKGASFILKDNTCRTDMKYHRFLIEGFKEQKVIEPIGCISDIPYDAA